jgi:hypothetical protein
VITAGQISVSGRVSTADGAGIRNVLVTLVEENGNIRTSVTGTFGYFRFDEITAGQVVVVSVYAKRFRFEQPVRVVSVEKDVAELDFIADR